MENWFKKELTEEQNSHIDIFEYTIDESQNKKIFNLDWLNNLKKLEKLNSLTS